MSLVYQFEQLKNRCQMTIKYFAYGSNMSLSRLRERAPGAKRMGTYILSAHTLRFHKVSRDNSGKCDAFHTKNPDDFVIGALFEIDLCEKKDLDTAEGLGHAYEEKMVVVVNASGEAVSASTYYATNIDDTLKPYSWYKNHVLIGAKESQLPQSYIQKIAAIECIEDPDQRREVEQRAIHQ